VRACVRESCLLLEVMSRDVLVGARARLIACEDKCCDLMSGCGGGGETMRRHVACAPRPSQTAALALLVDAIACSPTSPLHNLTTTDPLIHCKPQPLSRMDAGERASTSNCSSDKQQRAPPILPPPPLAPPRCKSNNNKRGDDNDDDHGGEDDSNGGSDSMGRLERMYGELVAEHAAWAAAAQVPSSSPPTLPPPMPLLRVAADGEDDGDNNVAEADAYSPATASLLSFSSDRCGPRCSPEILLARRRSPSPLGRGALARPALEQHEQALRRSGGGGGGRNVRVGNSTRATTTHRSSAAPPPGAAAPQQPSRLPPPPPFVPPAPPLPPLIIPLSSAPSPTPSASPNAAKSVAGRLMRAVAHALKKSSSGGRSGGGHAPVAASSSSSLASSSPPPPPPLPALLGAAPSCCDSPPATALRHLKERRLVAQQQQQALQAGSSGTRASSGGYAGPSAPRPGVLSAWEPPSGGGGRRPRWRPDEAAEGGGGRRPASSLSVVSVLLQLPPTPRWRQSPPPTPTLAAPVGRRPRGRASAATRGGATASAWR
jgi:hypothetical protein